MKTLVCNHARYRVTNRLARENALNATRREQMARGEKAPVAHVARCVVSRVLRAVGY